MYSIIFSQKARKYFSKLEKENKIRIVKALKRIRIRPEAHITRLVGESYYKFRVEDYRIIMDLQKDKLQILVIHIGHRKNIYKNM